MDPITALFSGGSGGLNVAPTSTATSGPINNKLSFGNSTVGSTAAGSTLPLVVTAATALFGLYIWKKVK